MIERVISQFVDAFNLMCKTGRRDFLVRERMVNYESESRIKRYPVEYKMKGKGDEWDIFAESEGFWIFKKNFPLSP